MRSIRRIQIVAAIIGVAVVQPQESIFAKSTSCATCPVAGVKSQETTGLGPSRTSGPCATRPARNGYPLPDPACTPGAFNPTVSEAVFGNKQFTTKCVRDCITNSAKKHTTYSSYHVTENPSCELDHLIPLEMGGADSLDNIWPQCGNAPAGKNYKDIKDQVESYLAIQVIKGVDLDKARKGIAADWTQYISDAQTFCAASGCDIQKYRK